MNFSREKSASSYVELHVSTYMIIQYDMAEFNDGISLIFIAKIFAQFSDWIVRFEGFLLVVVNTSSPLPFLAAIF